MAGSSGNTNCERIQQGANDMERLMGQKDYNSAMMKARQILELMVKQHAQMACIPDSGDLKDLIDKLYENQWINKTSFERYHNIRVIGNKAAHEGTDDANNANQVYRMLSQEVANFNKEYRDPPKGARRKSRRAAVFPPASGRPGNSQPAAPGRPGSSQPAGSGPNPASRRRRHASWPRRGIDTYSLLKLLVPVLSVILLICVIRLMAPEKKPVETIPETTTIADTTTAPENPAPETMAPVLYRTTTVLNVRSRPTTEGDRIGKLANGATVDYIEAYDDEWAIIRYNGQQAYVASRYLTTE